MNDEEIIKAWRTISSSLQKQNNMFIDREAAAIRLWRMAENATETRCLIIAKREMDLFAIEAVKRKLEAIDEAVAVARASEQDKAKAIQMLAFEQGIAEGYNHGQASVMATCSDCQKVQRKKGQADLKHKETKPEKPPPYTCQECGERHCWITEANRSHKKTKPERFSKANNRKWKAAHKKVK